MTTARRRFSAAARRDCRHRKSSFIALLRQRTGLRRHGCRRLRLHHRRADPANVDPLGRRAEIPHTNPRTDPRTDPPPRRFVAIKTSHLPCYRNIRSS